MPYLSKLIKRITLGCCLIALATACGGEVAVQSTEPETPVAPVTDSVASVSVSPDSSSAVRGTRMQMVAELRNGNGQVVQDRQLTWTSSDPAIATVDTTGLVTMVGTGTAEITADVRGKRGRSRIQVVPPSVASVQVTPTPSSVVRGQTVALSAQARSSTSEVITDRAVTWTSLSPAIATVSSSGVVSGVSAGTAQVNATIDGITGSAAITVTNPPPGAPSTVSDLSVTAVTDSSVTIRFTEVANGAEAPANYEIRYSTSGFDWSTALSPSRGSCTAQLTGTTIGAVRSCELRGLFAATLYRVAVRSLRGTTGPDAVYGAVSNVATGTTAQAPVPPPAAIATITLTPGTAAVLTGQTASFTATPRDAQGNALTGRSITWSSSNSAVATVSSTGVATGVAAGTMSVRATAEGITGSATLTVSVPPPAAVATITLAPGTASLVTGQTASFAATLRDSAGNVLTGRSVTWSSSNSAIATVSSSGVATAVAAGSASVRATSGSVTGSASLTVSAPVITATQVVIATQPGGALLGNALSPQPVVTLRGANNELVNSTAAVTVSIASGGGTLSGTTTVNAVGGVATFTNLSISGTAGLRTLRFSSGTLTAATSSSISITAPPSGSVLPWFNEDFSRYADNTAFMTIASPWSSNNTNTFTACAPSRSTGITLDRTQGYAGSPNSMRMSFPGMADCLPQRCDNSGAGRDLFANNTEFRGKQHLWFEFAVKFSANWAVQPPSDWGCANAPDHKTILLFTTAGDRWEVKVGNWGSVVRVGDPINGQTLNPNVSHPHYAAPYWNNEWFLIRMEILTGTDAGRFRVWMGPNESNMTLIHSNLSINIPTRQFGQLRMGSNRNTGSAVDTDWWVGRIRIFDQNPGW